jgi:hypothetical protein
MPPSRRLADLEKNLELRYETLGEVETDLAMTTNAFEKTAIKQRIREQVLPELRKYEAEYWQLLAQEARSCTVAEVDATNAIVEVEAQVVRVIESQPKLNDEVMELLLEIRDKLNEPGTPAAAKLKAALPLIPGILFYEFELDTENSLRTVLQPIKRLYKKAFDEGK